MIDLHYWPTPNGKKVTILLEECGMPYRLPAGGMRLVSCHIGKGDQFEDAFLNISPNNRMPAMVDDEPPGGGAPVSIFESGAMMMYIAEKAGRFYPQDLHGRYEVNQWVMWQMANQGPKFGERGHFNRLGDDEGDQSYALTRFSNEVNRLYGVMNNRLYDRAYLAGDDYTIADMISYPWTVYWEAQGQDIDEFKYFKRWYEELSAREAVQAGHGGRHRPARRPRHAFGRGEAAPPQAPLQPAGAARARLSQRPLLTPALSATPSYPSVAGRSLRSIACLCARLRATLRAIRRGARSRAPARFAARCPTVR